MRLSLFLVLLTSWRLTAAFPTHEDGNEERHRDDVDGESSRKIIGQSVVTSVSVIMNGDGEAPQFTDAVGKTVPRPRVPPHVASPINLLNPDRYEFYTFNDSGELVKRLMTLQEIQSIVANGNGAVIGDNDSETQSVILNSIPLSDQGSETRVQDIVDNVQHVLSREMENNKNISQIPALLLDTPDVSSSWSMILPAIFGNTGDEILPHKPINMTPETDIVDTTTTSKVEPTRKVTTTTKIPVMSRTAVPMKSTTVKAPAKSTKTSAKTSKAPAKTTKAPEKITKAPVKITKAPLKITKAPEKITEAPEKVTKAPEKITKAPETTQIIESKTAQTSPQPTATTVRFTTPIVSSTKKPTFKVKPKPSLTPRITTTTTLQPITESFTETTQTELPKTELPRTTTASKSTTVKKFVRKPTQPGYKRPMTNSPIIIERIEKKPLVVEAKTEGIEIESKTERVTKTPGTTVAMKTKAATTTTFKPTTVLKTTSELKIATSSELLKIETTTKKIEPETTPMMNVMDETTVSTSEEDRQDSAINQIIGSLQSDLFKAYERITTLDPPNEESSTSGGEKTRVPDKVLIKEELIVDEPEPIIRIITTTTSMSEEESTTGEPKFEKLEAMTTSSKISSIPLGNSEVAETIEKLIQEQINGKTKKQPEKLDILGFDDDEDMEIKLKGALEVKKNLTQAEFVTKASTIASSIISTSMKVIEETTTASPAFEENDTTVPTILSEALSSVIQLMIQEQETKKTTTDKPADDKIVANEPTDDDLNKLLHHYEKFNSHNDQLEALSMLSETFVATELPLPPQAQTTTVKSDDDFSYKTSVVKETSSVSMKLNQKPESTTTAEPETFEATTDPSKAEFSTFFSVADDEISSEESEEKFGQFTTEQFVVSEKRFSERKEHFTTASPPTTTLKSSESDEESSDLVSDVLNAIGIISDEEDEESTEKLKNTHDSQESDEVESAISSFSSTIDKTLSNDVQTDFTLTSKIASGLISVADSISESLGANILGSTNILGSSNILDVGDEESEEAGVETPTTLAAVKKQDLTTEKIEVTEKFEVTEKAEEITEKAEEITDKIEELTDKLEDENSTTESEADETLTEEYVMDSSESHTEEPESETESSTEKKTAKDPLSPMLQLSIIRKDNSLEEIEYFTPPGVTEVNFIKIENIETSTIPKMSGFKNKGQENNENIKPIYIALRSTTTAKSSQLQEASPSKSTLIDGEIIKTEEIATERVPLIEATKTAATPHFASTEDNLVEVKVQTVASTTEDQSMSTIAQLLPNSQTIKNTIKNSQQQQPRPQTPPIDLSATPGETLGLAASTAGLNSDLSDFSKICNELAFTFWKSITADGISQARSVVISPFALTSMLSMVFLGARGQTSNEMNDLLRLDDMVSFNPHIVFRNISESIEHSRKSGIAAAAFVRELYSDRANGKLLPYFKEKAQQFYGAHVEEVNFNVINDILRRRTNLLVKRHTFSKINEYLKTNNIWVNDPLAAVSANVFLTDCSNATMNERDGEMFFQVSPAIRQRRLIPIPAAVYRSGFTAGYDPILDATAVAFGDELHSTIMVMPGQQGSSIPGDNLDRLEAAFVEPKSDSFSRLLTTFMERPGLEVQIPRFSHRSLINATFALQQMGLKDLFHANKADLRGLTGAKTNDLYFSDMMQINQFSTCGEDKIGDSHHIEIYPSPSLKRNVNDEEDDEEDGKLEILSPDKSNMQYKSLFYDPIYDSRYMHVPLPLRPRQARLPENPRLRFDRPFLYFVRHNPTGIILFMGRFNPRLLP